MQKFMRLFCLVLACLMLTLSLSACSEGSSGVSGESSNTPSSSEDETTGRSEPPLSHTPETDAPETDVPETSGSDDTGSEESSSGEDSPNEILPYINPLTGLPTEKDFSNLRPAAIMINNIQLSCPQPGISAADVIYECLVEGGITRLMAVSMDYTALPEIGSVRSARHYYLAIAADYDALFVHIGGSTYAFDTIDEKQIQNLNGIEWMPTVFWQDATRLQTMGREHSWLTSGEGIASGVKLKRYRTILNDEMNYPLDFVSDEAKVTFTDSAEHIRIPLSHVQTTDFVYDAESGKYLRYQFSGVPHIDGATGEQLAFDNVIVYYCETGMITGDALKRIDIETNGTGKGFYATGGTYIPITWKKDSFESPIRFYTKDGEPLLINTGKTFVTVCPTYIESQIAMNYEW